MVKIIAVHNQKGGVGKTTTTTNVGFELARKGYKVLLADLDPQATLTSALGVTDPEETVFSALQGAVDGKETRLPWIRLQENISLCLRGGYAVLCYYFVSRLSPLPDAVFSQADE